MAKNRSFRTDRHYTNSMFPSKNLLLYSALNPLHTKKTMGMVLHEKMSFLIWLKSTGKLKSTHSLTVTFQLTLYGPIPYFKYRHPPTRPFLFPKVLRKTNIVICATNFLFLFKQFDNVVSGNDSKLPKPPPYGILRR